MKTQQHHMTIDSHVFWDILLKGRKFVQSLGGTPMSKGDDIILTFENNSIKGTVVYTDLITVYRYGAGGDTHLRLYQFELDRNEIELWFTEYDVDMEYCLPFTERTIADLELMYKYKGKLEGWDFEGHKLHNGNDVRLIKDFCVRIKDKSLRGQINKLLRKLWLKI